MAGGNSFDGDADEDDEAAVLLHNCVLDRTNVLWTDVKAWMVTNDCNTTDQRSVSENRSGNDRTIIVVIVRSCRAMWWCVCGWEFDGFFVVSRSELTSWRPTDMLCVAKIRAHKHNGKHTHETQG